MNITMNDDFDLKKIAESGQCFRWEPLGRESWRIPFRDHCLRAARIGDKTFELDCSEEEYERLWRGYFDLEENYAAIRARIEESADRICTGRPRSERGSVSSDRIFGRHW